MAEETKTKRRHLKKIETEETRDGHFLHHHTVTPSRHKDKPEEHHRNVAVSTTPEEAGQHIAEQFGMNEPPGENSEPAAAPQPDATAGGGAPDEAAGM